MNGDSTRGYGAATQESAVSHVPVPRVTRSLRDAIARAIPGAEALTPLAERRSGIWLRDRQATVESTDRGVRLVVTHEGQIYGVTPVPA